MHKKIPLILREMRRTVGAASPAVFPPGSPFKVLITTVLSQRTKDSNTRKAAAQLFARHRTANAIAGAQLEEIRCLIKPAGFYRQKAKRIIGISKELLLKHNGRVPSDMQQLLQLPGVGRKTANCVLVYGFGQPAIPVDVHVHRISNRIGLVKTKKPTQTELELMCVIPKRHWIELNHLMVHFGQHVCLPRNPKCMQCGLRNRCDYFLSVASKKQI